MCICEEIVFEKLSFNDYRTKYPSADWEELGKMYSGSTFGKAEALIWAGKAGATALVFLDERYCACFFALRRLG